MCAGQPAGFARMRPGMYAAFVSYRHVDPDRGWADWLQEALERHRTPRALVAAGIPRRIGTVFQDEKELACSADLGASLEAALDASAHLIVICSPRTPESRWVDAEIRRFQALGRGNRILAILIEGTPETAFPSALRLPRTAGPPTEPLAADARPRPGLSLRERRRTALLRTAAAILGCGYDELRQREAERARVRQRAVLFGLALLTAVLGGLLAWALHEERRAVQEAWLATRAREAERLARQEAEANLGRAYRAQAALSTDAFDAALLAARATDLLDDADSRGALLRSIASLPARCRWTVDPLAPGPLRAAWSPDGKRLAFATGGTDAFVVDLPDGRVSELLRAPSAPLVWLDFAPGQGLLRAVDALGVLHSAGGGPDRVPGPVRLDGVDAVLGGDPVPGHEAFVLSAGSALYRCLPRKDAAPVLVRDDLGGGGPVQVVVDPSGTWVLCAFADAPCRAIALATGQAVGMEADVADVVAASAGYAAGTWIVGTQDGSVYELRVRGTRLERHPFPPFHAQAVLAVRVTADRSGLVSLDAAGRLALWSPAGALVRSRRVGGGSAALVGASLSPRLDWIMAQEADGTLLLVPWDETARTRRIDAPAHPHRQGYALVVDPAEKWVVTCPQDARLQAYAAHDGSPGGTSTLGPDMVYDACLGPDAGEILVAGTDASLRRATAPAGPLLDEWTLGPGGPVRDLAGRGGTGEFLVVRDAGRVQWVDGGARRVLAEAVLEGERPLCAASDAEGRQVAVGTESGAVWLFEVGGDETATPALRRLHRASLPTAMAVHALRHDPRRDEWLVFSDAPEIQRLAAGEGTWRPSLPLRVPGAGAIAVDEARNHLAIAGRDGRVELLALDTLRPRGLFQAHRREIRHLAFGPQSGDLYTVGLHGSLRRWHLFPTAPSVPPAPRGVVLQTCLACTPEGDAVLTSGLPAGLLRRALPDGAAEHHAGRGGGMVLSLAISPDGSEVATTGVDGSIETWSLPDLQSRRTYQVPGGPKATAIYSPDGRRLAVGGLDGHLRVVEVDDGRVVHEERLHASILTRLAFHPSGRMLATAGRDRSVSVLAADTWERITKLDSHGSGVIGLAFSPDGARLAAGLENGSVWLWDVGTWRRHGVLTGHGHAVTFVLFHPGGRFLVSASLDGSVRVWDAQGGDALARVELDANGVGPLAWDPAEETLLAGSLRGGGLHGVGLEPLGSAPGTCLAQVERLLGFRLLGQRAVPASGLGFR